MAQTFCYSCGKALPYYAEYCPFCGKKVVLISTPPERNENKKHEHSTYDSELNYVSDSVYGTVNESLNDTVNKTVNKSVKKDSKNYSHLIRFLVLLIIVILAIGLKAANVEKEFQAEKQKESELLEAAQNDPVYRYFGSELQKNDPNAYLIYLKIADAVSSFKTSVYFSSGDSKLIKSLAYRVYCDYPEYFWYEGKAVITTKKNTAVTLTLKYNCEKEEREFRKEQLESTVHNLLVRIDGMSEYDKVKTVFDFLTRRITYDLSDMDQSCYSVLVEERGVCAGYASAFNYILGQSGMKCIYASGEYDKTEKTVNENTGHAWNLVNIKGDWYQVDVTQGDMDKQDGIMVSSYEYLLVTDKDIMYNRSYDEDLEYPECYATTYNYYNHEGLYLPKFDLYYIQAMLAQYLKKDMNFSFKCADYSTYKQSVSQLFSFGKLFEILENLGYSRDCKIMYGSNEKFLTVTVYFRELRSQ